MAKQRSYTYRNKSGGDAFLPDIGAVEKGKTITVDEPFDNPNFVPVTAGEKETDADEVKDTTRGTQ